MDDCLDHPLHDAKLGDWIYIKSFTGHPAGEKWKRPYQTLLTTYTAVKIKKAPAPEKSTTTWKAEIIGPTSVTRSREPQMETSF
uniref:Murine leukemia virus integrase C-terminal domain-containing protein n=1 Tax=Amazona collaria TaxID=241587 RepID=A0A8B9ITJ4_9PSIT